MYMTRSVLASSGTSQFAWDRGGVLRSFGDNVVKGGDYGAGSSVVIEPFK
jgi:hypothetical protein